jgi:hypothetical protein
MNLLIDLLAFVTLLLLLPRASEGLNALLSLWLPPTGAQRGFWRRSGSDGVTVRSAPDPLHAAGRPSLRHVPTTERSSRPNGADLTPVLSGSGFEPERKSSSLERAQMSGPSLINRLSRVSDDTTRPIADASIGLDRGAG